MPNALLAATSMQGLFGELDFAAMKEAKPNKLFDMAGIAGQSTQHDGCGVPGRLRKPLYFPMQKVEKIRFRMSSGVV
jgi:hypothetical protein